VRRLEQVRRAEPPAVLPVEAAALGLAGPRQDDLALEQGAQAGLALGLAATFIVLDRLGDDAETVGLL
jgi:hypothetical protein